MKVAVVIPVFGGVTDQYAKLCIKSLHETTDWPIIVVSNGTEDKPDFNVPGVTKHIHTPVQGQCNAVNLGVVAAGDVDYILVSNDDMYYAPGWNMNLRFDFPVFSPNLIEPTKPGGSAPPFEILDAGLSLAEFNKERVDGYVKERIHFGLAGDESGFNLPFFIRKKVWDTIGGYDTAFDPWGSNSDTDLQTAINLAGITPMRELDVLVYHFSNKSGTFGPEHQEFWQFNWDYFQEKWGFNRDDLKSDVWYNKDMLPADKSKILYRPDWAFKYA